MNKTKIIVVEDNIVYCEYVCNMLSREGYRNMKAYHLSTAKKHLQQATDNDIVVADLRLPDGSGICLLYTSPRHEAIRKVHSAVGRYGMQQKKKTCKSWIP